MQVKCPKCKANVSKVYVCKCGNDITKEKIIQTLMEMKMGKNKTPETIAIRDKNMERKLRQLSKDHPENKYEIKDKTITTKGKDYKLIQIKRVSGRRPHKIKDKNKVKTAVTPVTVMPVTIIEDKKDEVS